MASGVMAGLAGGSTLMSRWSSVFTAPALEWRIDRDARPAVGARRDARPIGALVVAIGALWLALALPALLGGSLPTAGVGVGAWASLAVGAALLLWGLRILLRRQTVRIGDGRVEVATRGIAGTTFWSEPLADYRGVVWRSRPIRRRGRSQTLHLVDLWHEDPARTVTLLSSMREAAAREAWEAWAQDLDLAAIRLPADQEDALAPAGRRAADPAAIGRRLTGGPISTRAGR